MHSSKLAGTPTASMATSAPSPPVSWLHEGDGVLTAVVDGAVRAELLGRVQAGVGQIDGDDLARGEELRPHDGREPDGAGADHGDGVARAGPWPLSTPTS